MLITNCLCTTLSSYSFRYNAAHSSSSPPYSSQYSYNNGLVVVSTSAHILVTDAKTAKSRGSCNQGWRHSRHDHGNRRRSSQAGEKTHKQSSGYVSSPQEWRSRPGHHDRRRRAHASACSHSEACWWRPTNRHAVACRRRGNAHHSAACWWTGPCATYTAAHQPHSAACWWSPIKHSAACRCRSSNNTAHSTACWWHIYQRWRTTLAGFDGPDEHTAVSIVTAAIRDQGTEISSTKYYKF